MSNQIEQPVFYEGQILAVSDLQATVEHASGEQARHERYLHLWGIAHGLALTGKDKQTAQGASYKEVTLSAGVAIDGTGREVLVPEAEQVSEDLFAQLNVAISDKEAWYPVFLIGRDEPAPPTTTVVGACNSSLPTRLLEGYEIVFGRPGDELDLDTQEVPEVVDGPGSAAWKVLLGFVQWDATLKHFKDAADDSGGIGRRYAGVQADVVAARAGRLTLRTETTNQAGKPAILLDETNKDGLLQFGLLTDTGGVTPLLSVNDKGDLTVPGTISGTTAAGTLKVESGIATDGMVLPLPAGVTEKQVADGQAVVHMHVSLQIREKDAPNTSNLWGAFPLEAFVDEQRRVHCRVRWMQLPGGASIVDRSSFCLYTVLASVK